MCQCGLGQEDLWSCSIFKDVECYGYDLWLCFVLYICCEESMEIFQCAIGGPVVAGILLGVGFQATRLCDMVGGKGPVPAEGNHVNISCKVDFLLTGLASL